MRGARDVTDPEIRRYSPGPAHPFPRLHEDYQPGQDIAEFFQADNGTASGEDPLHPCRGAKGRSLREGYAPPTRVAAPFPPSRKRRRRAPRRSCIIRCTCPCTRRSFSPSVAAYRGGKGHTHLRARLSSPFFVPLHSNSWPSFSFPRFFFPTAPCIDSWNDYVGLFQRTTSPGPVQGDCIIC